MGQLLLILDTEGNKLYENVYGDKGANNAGEYLSVDPNNGDIMIYTDSDSFGGVFGFLKLSPTNSPPTSSQPARQHPQVLNLVLIFGQRKNATKRKRKENVTR